MRSSNLLPLALLALYGCSDPATEPTATNDAGPETAVDGTPLPEASVDAAEEAATDTADAPAEAARDGEVVEKETGARIVVTDDESGTLSIYDIERGAFLAETVAIEKGARVYPGSGGRYVFALLRDLNKTELIDTGLVVTAHDDHEHLEKRAPRRVDLGARALLAQKPTHFVAHDGLVAIFNDGDGSFDVVDESKLRVLVPESIRRISVVSAHHGVAVPFPDAFLVSATKTGETSPSLVHALDDKGDKKADFDGCPGLHGEAANETTVAFGCSDGVLLLTKGAAGFTAKKIPNPTDAGDLRVGTVKGHHDVGHFIGNFGPQALAKIDPAGTITKWDLPTRHLGFELDHDGKQVIVLTADGKIHVLDASTGVSAGSVDAITAVATGTPSLQNPQIVVDEDHVWVTDPAAKKLVSIDLATRTIDKSVTAPGKPTKAALVRATANHDHDHDHDHKH
jgi:DNA-binding beta-propeller fold protein YncE